mmetsp:Transcript_31492/g.91049  ORF Transcript_31492/g.91049 Transcript_31492/m.91049 type:complete len:237 (+) Transcript_31492:175-885(+)
MSAHAPKRPCARGAGGPATPDAASTSKAARLAPKSRCRVAVRTNEGKLVPSETSGPMACESHGCRLHPTGGRSGDLARDPPEAGDRSLADVRQQHEGSPVHALHARLGAKVVVPNRGDGGVHAAHHIRRQARDSHLPYRELLLVYHRWRRLAELNENILDVGQILGRMTTHVLPHHHSHTVQLQVANRDLAAKRAQDPQDVKLCTHGPNMQQVLALVTTRVAQNAISQVKTPEEEA